MAIIIGSKMVNLYLEMVPTLNMCWHMSQVNDMDNSTGQASNCSKKLGRCMMVLTAQARGLASMESTAYFANLRCTTFGCGGQLFARHQHHCKGLELSITSAKSCNGAQSIKYILSCDPSTQVSRKGNCYCIN